MATLGREARRPYDLPEGERMAEPDETVDVVIAGSGAAGLVAALTASAQGLRPLVIEKSDKLGGSTAYSGGGLWIPNNPVQQAAGVPDSFEAALTYMEGVIEDVGPASSPERKRAFLRRGPEMVAFLQGLGFEWMAATGYPDYYPDRPGASTAGRCVEGKT